ncbi:ribosome maturation factor [Helicobacter anseris]|uniref:Ribosome maturation factor RimP n=1 Tax=Helicobacter anseris TaxID=375926 RepID=A0A3D8JAY3_9HELI|nr:ribosome maturation factor RimP [Helicobacter anseris]RDU74608.1 ribosome maturation factor [Helicobacter anseris]
MVSLELEQKIEKVIQSFGFELYDISFLKENKNDIFRISIASNTKRVTLDVCQEISEVLSPLLDVYIRDDKPYFMEVSSPGIERILKTPRHFSLSLNQKVLVRLDNKEEFEAILKDLNDDNVTFEIDGVNQQYPFDRLKKVKTILEW